MTSRNYLIIWSIRFHVLLKAKRINLVFLKDWNNLEYDMKQQSANHSVYLGCAMSYAMSYAQHNFKHFNKKKNPKNERNKTQEVLSEMYFKSRDKFNKNCPNYFKQNSFFLLWYCFIKVMKHINHYFVRTLVHKFLITHTIHVFYYISSKENCSEHTCVISVTCSERWHPSNITRN